MANIITGASDERARVLLSALDKVHADPPQYLTIAELEEIFSAAQQLRIQLERLKK